MAKKAYWIWFFRGVKNPEAYVAYKKLAPQAVLAAGGRFLVRGDPAQVYEADLNLCVAN